MLVFLIYQESACRNQGIMGCTEEVIENEKWVESLPGKSRIYAVLTNPAGSTSLYYPDTNQKDRKIVRN
jgi:hypothetical protein